jgi:integrase
MAGEEEETTMRIHAALAMKLHAIPQITVRNSDYHSLSYFWSELDRAAKESGIGHIGTHTFRHSYRMWIDAIGTPIGVQQKFMRHSDIRTTMNIYGDAATEDIREAHGKIVSLALNGTEIGTGDS